VESEPKTCPSCGGERFPDAAYCAWCGTALTPPAGPAATAAPAVVAPGGPTGQESRYWAIGAHLSALAGGFLGGVPAFLGPLIVWLVRKDTDPYAAGHGRDALNFNLSVLLYGVGLVVLSLFTFGLGLLVALPAGLALIVAWLVLSIIGAIKAANDEPYHYPLAIQFVR
jgi:uncharacterized Tic20 family protein